jgi:hypothetical protein
MQAALGTTHVEAPMPPAFRPVFFLKYACVYEVHPLGSLRLLTAGEKLQLITCRTGTTV